MPNPSRSARGLQLLCDAILDVTSISVMKSSSPNGGTSHGHPHSLLYASASCMDLSRHGQDTPSSRQLRTRQSSTSLQQPLTSAGSRTQAHSTPLPQAQWSEIPLPFRPRHWVSPEEQRQQLPSNPSYDWRLRPAIPGHALSGTQAQVPAPLRPRRRPTRLADSPRRPTHGHREGQAINFSLLYPQMSPYDECFSAYSAPDELPHIPRSVSQPSSASYSQQRFEESEPIPMQFPRSPTYPPAGRRRMHSDSGVQDGAFRDEEEFRLFVAATAGLGPETACRHNSRSYQSSSSSSQRQGSRNSPQAGNHTSFANEMVSPLEETPTTLFAYHQLAQMPLAVDLTQRPRRERLQTSPSGLDLWLQPPNTASQPVFAIDASPLEPSEDYLLPSDDELPDYASSQAQAHAASRVEATRRARSLQRRWRASSERQGR